MDVREVPIEQSVGLTLAYDLTGITPGKTKGAVLRRGHLIDVGDLDVLRDIGKSHIKVLELARNEVHEDDAAEQLGLMLRGCCLDLVMPGEAWVDLVARQDGLLKVDHDRLQRLNLLDGVLVATRHNNTPVASGETVARAKVRGLAVYQTILDQAREVAAAPSPVLSVMPYRSLRGGAVITGREIYEGRKKDAFEPLLRQRLEERGSELVYVEVVPDEIPAISEGIRSAVDAGSKIVFVTGGGSPDDCTSEAMAQSAEEVVFHGVPVAPGAMTMLSYARGVPILGVPGGLLARPRGFIDLILPRLLAGERPTRAEISTYGHGGLCLRCANCVFPACPFGK